jgi:GTP cyclohydrolase I
MSMAHSNGKSNSARVKSDDPIELKLDSEDFLEMFELNLPAVDTNKIEAATLEILEAVGEDPQREGLLRTPERVARAYEELLSGYRVDPVKLINEAIFNVEYDDMVIVRDIEFYSLCVPSRQIVNGMEGAKRAADVQLGEQLWTLHEGRVVPTTVTNITSHQTRELVEIETEEGLLRVTPDHPFATPHGWMEAKDLEGGQIEWTHPKKLLRGFIDGYVEGDGFKNKASAGSTVISANVPFLAEFANVIGEHFTPNYGPTAPKLYIADSWQRKHGFHQEDHRTDLHESEWVPVKRVTKLEAEGKKPYTVYSFTCEPYPTFLIGGHLSHNCEHHMLPFIGRAHVAYISSGKVIGLSKIPRIVDMFARRLQVQERMTHQIAEFLNEVLQPRGVAVVLDGIHMCSMMRGVKKENASMTTSAMLGQFREDEKTRAEFMTHITRAGSSGGFGK